jgi:AraC family transcriptional regulator of adaptative response/methylated-DNA-[protein]-cysteine methyltransferase
MKRMEHNLSPPHVWTSGKLPARLCYSTMVWEFGTLLLAVSEHGLAVVSFARHPQQFLQNYPQKWRSICWQEDPKGLRNYQEALRDWLNTMAGEYPLPLDLRGSDFQQQVWQVLRSIPHGSVRTYAQVAQDIGRPRATRAVAQACAANRLALLVPCHRVIRSDGSLGGYRWGQKLKHLLLQHESRI